ncbi:uncharacterized protein LOC121770144 [Salvia splendens]|uniref:uncharacterized protein LOC121770144 n=1 Tax=Salvia splendens TaxID=180675 RepID=UPI001C265076|nr:uncharacterized protein LOC121770144 [Salvia splendens]
MVRDKEEALKANLFQKQHLSEMQFQWGENCSGDRNDESVLEDCEEITFGHLPNLGKLSIRELKSLKSLDGLENLNSLMALTIENCTNLKSIGNPRCGEEGTLFHLSIVGCGELMELPSQMLELWAPTIQSVGLGKLRSVQNLPMLIDCLARSFTHLRRLAITGVPKLMSAGSVESWDLGSLKYLTLDVSVEWSNGSSVAINDTVNGILEGCCNSLKQLTLIGVESWECLPQSIQHLTSLRDLRLENIGIEELPQWFDKLSFLLSLHLDGCTKLRRLHSVDALKPLIKFHFFTISNCPKLSIDSELLNHPDFVIKVDGNPI